MNYETVFVVTECDVCCNNVYGVYQTKEDAWEAIFTEAETFAYENMMCCDRGDVLEGEDGEWTWADYDFLFWDAVRSFEINEVIIFN